MMTTLPLAEKLFEVENVPFKKIEGTPEAFRLAKGRLSPQNAVVLVALPNTNRAEVILDIYEAVEFVTKHGLRRA